MGHTRARVRIYNPQDPLRHVDLELLVDTGSTFTWIRRTRLEELGIRPMDRARFRTTDNRIVMRDVGEAVVECLGRRATTAVVFAEESDNEVLGLHALEGLRLEVDPVSGQLREVEAVLALQATLASALKP